MNSLNKIIFTIIFWQLLIFPSAICANEVKAQKHITNLAVKLIQAEMTNNSQLYFPTRYTEVQKDTIADSVVSANNEILQKLKDDSFSLSEIKDNIVKSIVEEEQNHVRELRFALELMDLSKIEEIFYQSYKDGFYLKDYLEDFEYAFTLDQKREVLLSMVVSDLSLIKSSSVKRVGMSSREQLIEELNLTNSFFVVKGKKWKETVLIALSIALAGFATWGIFSNIKKSYAEKTKKMHEDYDRQETNLEASYAQKEIDLLKVFEERSKLREEGYVWQVCKTETRNKSASCSYDYSQRQGSEVCTTMCLKNPNTNQEAQHSTSCTSAFIPNNCFIKNPYEAGYDDGHDRGYDDGYDVAYQRAYDDAYYEYYNDAYDSAYSRGYDYGYSKGYSDGLAQAEYDDTEVICDPEFESCLESFIGYKNFTPVNQDVDQRSLGQKKGYKEGYTFAQMMLLGL